MQEVNIDLRVKYNNIDLKITIKIIERSVLKLHQAHNIITIICIVGAFHIYRYFIVDLNIEQEYICRDIL
jgi:hypothetical protein